MMIVIRNRAYGARRVEAEHYLSELEQIRSSGSRLASSRWESYWSCSLDAAPSRCRGDWRTADDAWMSSLRARHRSRNRHYALQAQRAGSHVPTCGARPLPHSPPRARWQPERRLYRFALINNLLVALALINNLLGGTTPVGSA